MAKPLPRNESICDFCSCIGIHRESLKVKLPSSIFYSNASSEIQKIEWDAGDGLGFRLMPYHQLINVTYATDGEKIWKYRLTLNTGQSLLSHSKIWVRKGLKITKAADICDPVNINCMAARTANATTWTNCNPTNTDVYYLDFISTTAYNGKNAKARVFIDDAGGDCKITKPLIVVDGWDVTTLLNPESKFSSKDYEEFLETVKKGGDLSTLLIKNQAIPHDQKYDIIYVNWDNGMDDIRRNALVVQEI